MLIKQIVENFQNYSVKLIKESIKEGRDIAQSQSGTEAESSKDYFGRVAFEFFQNAVDRADQNIWMELTKESFIISNDGKKFSIYGNDEKVNHKNKKSDFHSLNSIHNGEKVAGESIGNKGVGFKSCWNISEYVIIESKKDNEPWGFELFNPVKSELFQDNKIIEAIKNANGRVPSFYFPRYFKSKLENFRTGAVTKITIKLNDSKAYEEIKKELEEFKKTKFIFLNMLQGKKDKQYNIHISIDGIEEKINSMDNSWHIINLKDKNNDDWNDLKKSKENENYKNIPKEPNIAIAFPPEKEGAIDAKIYTYLPTKIESGFNVLIHADFVLDNARVSIPENQYNKKILEIAAKMFVCELLENEVLHERTDFAKFLIPKDKNDTFAHSVWQELIKNNNLQNILKKVYTTERNFSIESYEMIFESIREWIPAHKSGHSWENYYNKDAYNVLQYYCGEEIYIVWINEEEKTFLPPKSKLKDDKHSLFYQTADEKKETLNYELIQSIKNIKITNFKTLESVQEVLLKNNIIRKFTTIETLRVLKKYEDIKIIRFIEQLLNNTKETLSEEVKKQLYEVKLPTLNNGFQEVKKCYWNIKNIPINSNFYEVDLEKLKEIENLENFMEKIGVAKNRLPFYEEKNNVILPFDAETEFNKSNDMKDFVLNSVDYMCDEVIDSLKEIEWFYDERKNKLYKPSELFVFKEHDHREIDSIAQEKKDSRYSRLYELFDIDEIEDTKDKDKIIRQLYSMKEKHIDSSHQDIYKKLTYQLAKISDTQDENIDIPLLAIHIKNNEISYVNVEDKSKIIFLETKYKKYKEQLKDTYDYLIYFDTNISHKFVLNVIGIKVFNPNYTIIYKDRDGNEINPEEDNDLKQELQDEFLATFFALANEVLGSRFEKEDAIKRWENLVIKKSHNIVLTISENGTQITIASTENSNVDVLYIPIKDKNNNPTKIGEVAHDLEEPLKNQHLRKFSDVFAEGIFRSQKLKSDFELYIIAWLAEKEELKKDILFNKGVENSHIKEMESFIKENLLTSEEKRKLVGTVSKITNLSINSENWKDFNQYKALEMEFSEFKSKFDNTKYQSIIENFIAEYRQYLKAYILNNIEENRQHLQVLCFKQKKKRDYFQKQYENIKKKNSKKFNEVVDIFKLFSVNNEDKKSNEYTEAMLDFENYTDETSTDVTGLKVVKNSLKQKENPSTGNAKQPQQKSKEEQQKNEKIGIGQELKVAYTIAKEITDKENFIKIIKDNIFKDDEALKENKNLKKYRENLDKYKDADNLDFAKNVIQIASHNLDGLGYDLIIPDNKYGILKVELKSTTRKENIELHFSKNEIERILHYMEVDNWGIWLNNSNKDLTKAVKKAVKDFSEKNRDSFFYSNDYILKLN